MNLQRSFLFCGALAFAALNTGCKDKQDTKVYSVEKTPAGAPADAHKGGDMPAATPPGHPAVGAMGGMNGMGAPNMGSQPAPEINTGTAPAHWEMLPPTSMRLANFRVKGDKDATAEISLIILNGAAGGVLDNVNRWQAQLGQPDLSADELAQKAQHLSSSLGEMTLVDLQGLAQGADATKDGRIIAAIVVHENMAFFFKMRGNAELVEAQKADFIQWIGTVRPMRRLSALSST